jgi:flagellar assembly factor FliW
MEIITKRFGPIQADENQILIMETGLIGFPELKRFILINMEEQAPFRWFQSIDDESIAFVVLNPASFKPDYTASLSQAEFDRLGLNSMQDIVLSVIATIGEDPSKMTVNLKAPLVFNRQNRKGMQLILRDPSYQTQHNLMEELEKAKKQSYKSDHLYQTNVYMSDQGIQQSNNLK